MSATSAPVPGEEGPDILAGGGVVREPGHICSDPSCDSLPSGWGSLGGTASPSAVPTGNVLHERFFLHLPGQSVFIPALECYARIVCIILDEAGHEYKIQYFINGEQHQAYVKDADIGKA